MPGHCATTCLYRLLILGCAVFAGLTPAQVARAAESLDPAPGTRIMVTLDDLPAPYAEASPANPPRHVTRPQGVVPRVPDGFEVSLFADGLTHARWLMVAENGDVFLAESRAGRVTLLRDSDGDGPGRSDPALHHRIVAASRHGDPGRLLLCRRHQRGMALCLPAGCDVARR